MLRIDSSRKQIDGLAWVVTLCLVGNPFLPVVARAEGERPAAQPKTEQTSSEPAKPASTEENPVYESLVRGTLYIEARDAEDSVWSGTGWLLDIERRLVVTNYHVVSNSSARTEGTPAPATTLFAWFPVRDEEGEIIHDAAHYAKRVDRIAAEVLYTDPARDLALLRLASLPKDVAQLPLAARSPRAGDRLHALAGFPRGSEGLFIYTQGTSRAIYQRGIAQGGRIKVLETQMPLNQGNSGGAIVNDAGEVVAVFEGLMTEPKVQLVNMCIDLSEVRAFLDAALPLADPQEIQDWNRRGKNHYDARRFDLALADFNAAVRLDPKHAPSLASRGWVYYQSGDLDTALAEFKDALTQNEHLVLALRGRGLAQLDRGDHAAAIEDFTHAIRFADDPQEAALLLNDRGWAHYNADQNDQAIADYDRAIEKNPTLSIALRNKGRVLADQEQYDAALEALAKTVELDQQDPEAFNLAGNIWFAKEEFQTSLEMYSNALNRNNRVAQYYCNRGGALRRLKRLAEAINDHQAAIAIDPSNSDFFNELGLACFDGAQYQEAAAAFAKASELDGQNAIYHRNRGDCLHRLEQYEAANAAFTQAVSLDDQDAELFAMRGRSRQAGGLIDGAMSDFDKAVEMAPDVYKKHVTKSLVIKNDTEEEIQVSLQYYARSTDGNFYWYPGTPESGKALLYTFAPGEEAPLLNGEYRVYASRMRIWGESDAHEWMGAKDEDVILVPEGGYLSESTERETFRYTFMLQ